MAHIRRELRIKDRNTVFKYLFPYVSVKGFPNRVKLWLEQTGEASYQVRTNNGFLKFSYRIDEETNSYIFLAYDPYGDTTKPIGFKFSGSDLQGDQHLDTFLYEYIDYWISKFSNTWLSKVAAEDEKDAVFKIQGVTDYWLEILEGEASKDIAAEEKKLLDLIWKYKHTTNRRSAEHKDALKNQLIEANREFNRSLGKTPIIGNLPPLPDHNSKSVITEKAGLYREFVKVKFTNEQLEWLKEIVDRTPMQIDRPEVIRACVEIIRCKMNKMPLPFTVFNILEDKK